MYAWIFSSCISPPLFPPHASSNIRALTHIDVHKHAYLFLMLSAIMHVSSCLQTCDNDVTKQLLRFSLLALC